MPYQVRSRIFVAKTKNTTDCLIAGTARAIARPEKQICKDEFTLYWGADPDLVAGHRHLRRSSISRMASVIEASGEMQTGSGVMTSAAFMGVLVRSNVSCVNARLMARFVQISARSHDEHKHRDDVD